MRMQPLRAVDRTALVVVIALLITITLTSAGEALLPQWVGDWLGRVALNFLVMLITLKLINHGLPALRGGQKADPEL